MSDDNSDSGNATIGCLLTALVVMLFGLIMGWWSIEARTTPPPSQPAPAEKTKQARLSAI